MQEITCARACVDIFRHAFFRVSEKPATMSSRLSSAAEKQLKFGCWERLQVSGTPPSIRFAHSCVVVEDVMYVFGGSSYGESEDTLYHNDMYTLKCKRTMQARS